MITTAMSKPTVCRNIRSTQPASKPPTQIEVITIKEEETSDDDIIEIFPGISKVSSASTGSTLTPAQPTLTPKKPKKTKNTAKRPKRSSSSKTLVEPEPEFIFRKPKKLRTYSRFEDPENLVCKIGSSDSLVVPTEEETERSKEPKSTTTTVKTTNTLPTTKRRIIGIIHAKKLNLNGIPSNIKIIPNGTTQPQLTTQIVAVEEGEVETEVEEDEVDDDHKEDTKVKTKSLFCIKLQSCNEVFRSRKKQLEHHQKYHNLLKYRCFQRGCQESFELKSELTEHLQVHHKKPSPGDHQTWRCSKCQQTFTDHDYLANHDFLYHQEGLFSCRHPGCPFEGPNYQTVNLHYLKLHEGSINCSVCSKQLYGWQQQKAHELFHRGIMPFTCTYPQCNWKGSKEAAIACSHVKRCHMKKLNNLSFHPRQYIQMHPEMTKLEKPRSAPDLTSTQVLARRGQQPQPVKLQRTHMLRLKILSLRCTTEECTLTFTTPSALAEHLTNDHSIALVRCLLQGCSRSFDDTNALTQHFTSDHNHPPGTPFRCSRCQYLARDHGTLERHTFFHHHYGQFACDIDACSFIACTRQAAREHFDDAHKDRVVVKIG